jgi:hypothetical protein
VNFAHLRRAVKERKIPDESSKYGTAFSICLDLPVSFVITWITSSRINGFCPEKNILKQ